MNTRTQIVGLYRYPQKKSLGNWAREHRQMIARDFVYRAQVYACLAVWIVTWFVPLVYFAFHPEQFVALSRGVSLLIAVQLLFGGAACLFLRRCRKRALTRHHEV
jgi:hypothetical protein